MKRIFDILSSLTGLILLFPLLLVLSLIIVADSKGGVFFRQVRVGKNNKDFRLFKFRTMRTDADKLGLITVGGRDPRVTRAGYFLRKYKLDELPQLINILKGDMSVVGPRPEVRKYVDMYTVEQLNILSIKPGLTDFASIAYINENEILEKSADPEKTYIEEIMQDKLRLNARYLQEQSFFTDMKIIAQTLVRIIGK